MSKPASDCRERAFFFRVSSLALAGSVATLAMAGDAFACVDDGSDAPEIGLVLSGGGALAAAHVGAIKAIEEAGVPIHCVVGSSMGSVVGALYATGMDATSLQDVFVDADWGVIATGLFRYRDQGFRQKDDQRRFFSDYVIGISRDGLALPSGVSSLRGMRAYLREQTGAFGHVVDFNDLPIPYRAVTTDLASGEATVLAAGDLVGSALASMAVPGLYPNQLIDGRWYVDGGMSRQVPIDFARGMGADIVIVIDTTIPPPESLSHGASAFASVMQMFKLQTWANRQEQIKLLGPDDLHITPDMTGYSTSGFDQLADGYGVGYETARKSIDRLRQIAAIAAPPLAPKPTQPREFAVDSVVIASNSGVADSILLNRFGVNPGDIVTFEELEDRIRDVTAIGMFDSVDYRLTSTTDARTIELHTSPRGSGVQHLQLGARFSTTLDGDASYGLLGRWTIAPINAAAGAVHITGEVGSDVALDVDWVQPFGASGRYFVEAGVGYAERIVPVQIDTLLLAERRDQTGEVRARAGRELGQWGLVSLGAFATDLDTDIRVGSLTPLGAQSGTYVGVEGRLAADVLNSPTFPTRGAAADLRVRRFNNTEDDRTATQTSLNLSAAGTLGETGLFANFEGGHLDQNLEGLPAFNLGGFKRLSGFQDNSVPATTYGMLRLEAFRRLGASIEQSFGVPVYVGATLEHAEIEIDLLGLSDSGGLTAGSVYASVATPLGPAYFALGFGESGRSAAYVYFGRAF